ncbi:MAG: CAP domain-containing protein [Oscillospiraceae bacterium]
MVKRLLSLLLAFVFVICFSFGCSRYLNKDEAPKTTLSQKKAPAKKSNIQNTTTKKVTTNSLPAPKKPVVTKQATNKQPKQETQAPTKPPYSVTTRYAGTSTLTYTKQTIPYTADGQQMSTTVTVVTGFEDEMLAYVNNERANAKRNSLSLEPELTRMAIIRAAEASIKWSHIRPDGTKCFTILDTSPLKPRITEAGENLGWNQTSVVEVMNEWMNSTGHRANIISAYNNYNNVGFAWIIAENGDHFWAQLFAQLK